MPEIDGMSLRRTQTRATQKRGAKSKSLVALPRVMVGIVGLLSLLIAACGTNNNNGSTLAKDQVFTWPYQNSVTSITHGEVLDPGVVQAAVDNGTVSMIYTSLVTFKSDLSVIPDAASTWDIDSSGKVYTFHLRPNLHFSDGTPLTAADFAYSINRALDPTLCTVQDAFSYGFGTGPNGTPPSGGQCIAKPGASGPPPIAATYLQYILGADKRLSGAGGNDQSLIGQGDDPNHGLDVIDPQTLRIRLSAPAAFFLEALTYPTAMPVEQSLVKKYPGGLWVDHLDQGGCSGPFMMKSYGGGQALTLVPNPYWEKAWGKQLTLTEVHRPLATSIDNEYTSYLGGQYDYTTVPGNQYSFARGQNDFHEVPTLATDYFGLNFHVAPFDNLQVRRAFALALNKQLLVDRVLNGSEIPTNHIVPRGMPGFDSNLHQPPPDGTQSLTGNQSAAIALLKQAKGQCTSGESAASGPPDFCPFIMNGTKSQEITIWTNNNNGTRDQFVAAAAQEWSDVLQLNVHVKLIPFNTFLQNLVPYTGPYQAWALGWLADYPDPQDWLSSQFNSKVTNNAAGVSDSQLDSLMAQADSNLNSTQRMQQYNQAEQTVIDDVAWIPYAQQKSFWRQRVWVHGFSLNSLQNMVDINWPNVYITTY